MVRIYNPFKRVYIDKVKEWMSTTKITGIASAGLAIFYYLVFAGAIIPLSDSVDVICTSNYCESSEFTFTAIKDVYIYPDDEWLPPNVVLKRTWGDSWRTINLSKTWSKDVKYAIKFSMGNTYTIKYFVYDKAPWEDVELKMFENCPAILGEYEKVDYFRIATDSKELIPINDDDVKRHVGIGDAWTEYLDCNPTLTTLTTDQKSFDNSFTYGAEYVKNARVEYKNTEKKTKEIINLTGYRDIHEIVCEKDNKTLKENCTDVSRTEPTYETIKVSYDYEYWSEDVPDTLPGECRTVRIYGELIPTLGERSIEHQPCVYGEVFKEYDWWNSTYGYRYPCGMNGTSAVGISCNGTKFVGGDIAWVTNTTDKIYAYCTVQGCATGDVEFATDTANVNWENETSRTGNKPTKVWSEENAVMVLHMNNEGPTIHDSTNYGHDAIVAGLLNATNFFGNYIFGPTVTNGKYWYVPTAGHTEFDSENFTVAFWTNTTSTGYVLIDRSTALTPAINKVQIRIGVGGTPMSVNLAYYNGAAYELCQANHLFDGTTKHVMISLKSHDAVRIYVNGVLNKTCATAGVIGGAVGGIIRTQRFDDKYPAATLWEEFRWYNVSKDAATAWTLYSSKDMVTGAEETAPAAPTVTLNSPDDASSTASSSVTFNCSVGNTPDNVTLYHNYTSWHANETNDTGGDDDYLFTKTFSDGDYVWNCYACNSDGCSFGTNRTFTVDIVPQITIFQPENTTTSNTTQTLHISLSNADDTILYSLDGGANQTYTTNTTLGTLGHGSHNVVVWANNSYGLMNSSTRYFTIDIEGPDILITSPTNTTYNTTTIELKWYADETPDWAAYSLNGGANNTGIFPKAGENLLHLGNISGVGTPNYLQGAFDVFATEGVAYVVAYQDYSFTTFDVSDPSDITLLGNISGGGNPNYLAEAISIFVVDDVAYVVSYADDALTTFNVSDPTNLVHLGNISGNNTPNYLDGAQGVFVSGDVAYVVSYREDALTTFNVSDPSNIVHMGNISGADNPNYLNGPLNVYVSGGVAYVASHLNNALTTFNVSDPSNIVHMGNISGTGSPNYLYKAYGVHVSGNVAYVASETADALSAFNISDPSNIVLLGTITGAGSPNYLNGARDVFVYNDTAYVVSYADYALSSFDVTDPTNMIHRGNISGAGSPNYLNSPSGMYIYNDVAYVAARIDNALTTFDVSSGFRNVTLTVPEGRNNITICANDTLGNTNCSTVFFSIDITTPFYTNFGSNKTSPMFSGQSLGAYALWNDTLSNLSHYIFEWNGSGSFVNITNTFTGQVNWSNITVDIPEVAIGKDVGFRFYVNDTSGNLNVTTTSIFNVDFVNITLTTDAFVLNLTSGNLTWNWSSSQVYWVNATPENQTVSIGIFKMETFENTDLNVTLNDTLPACMSYIVGNTSNADAGVSIDNLDNYTIWDNISVTKFIWITIKMNWCRVGYTGDMFNGTIVFWADMAV